MARGIGDLGGPRKRGAAGVASGGRIGYLRSPKEARMPEMPQAVELAQLVELESQWENLPHASTNGARELHAKQGAYEAYRSRRAAYDGKHSHHNPRAMVNSPARLGAWLAAMRDLFAKAE